jgi:hypothetical protein
MGALGAWYYSVDWDVAGSVANIFLALITLLYVILTYLLVRESLRARDPLVSVDFELKDTQLLLTVENRGMTPAKDIRIEVVRESDWLTTASHGKSLSAHHAVRNGISYLAPSRKLLYWLAVPRLAKDSIDESGVELRVSFCSLGGKRFRQDMTCKFNHLEGVEYGSFKDPIAAIASDVQRAVSILSGMEMQRDISIGLPKKYCIMCAELIMEPAKKCKHCGEFQEPPRSEAKPARARKRQQPLGATHESDATAAS